MLVISAMIRLHLRDYIFVFLIYFADLSKNKVDGRYTLVPGTI